MMHFCGYFPEEALLTPTELRLSDVLMWIFFIKFKELRFRIRTRKKLQNMISDLLIVIPENSRPDVIKGMNDALSGKQQ